MTSKSAKLSAKPYYGTGRRKTAVARVFVRPGKGQIEIEGLPLNDYLKRRTACMVAMEVLESFGLKDKVDIYATVQGGGIMGQAGALRLGMARALAVYDDAESLSFDLSERVANDARINPSPYLVSSESEDEDEGDGEGESTLEKTPPLTLRRALRKLKFLTRDARKVERKKVGHRKARKVEQYSKR